MSNNYNSRTDDEFGKGVGLTVLYFLLVSAVAFLYIFFTDSENFKLNELGDFLAGIFAPLAFLWLILSYRQQAHELRLQSKELSDSVKEFKHQNELIASQLISHVPSFNPMMIVRTDEIFTGKSRNSMMFDVELTNSGGSAKNMCVGIYRYPCVTQTHTMREEFLSGISKKLSIHCARHNDHESPLYLVLTGWDSLDRYFRSDFVTTTTNFRPSSKKMIGLPIKPIKIVETMPENPSGYTSCPAIDEIEAMDWNTYLNHFPDQNDSNIE